MFAVAAALALILTVFIGVDRAIAGLTSAFTVDIFAPEDDPLVLTAYTPNAQVPPSIPLGVKSLVNSAVRGGTTIADSVETTLGGTRNGGTVTGALQSVDPTLVNDLPISDEYLAVVDASLLDFEPVVRGATTLFASDFIRTIAAADSYYAFAETRVDITIQDLSDIDSDGNLIPDATALLQPFLILMDGAGNITIVLSLDNPGIRGGVDLLTYELALDTVLGPINLLVSAPSLNEIIAQSGGVLSGFNTGRLIVTISPDPAEALDGPSGVNPLSEFDLEDDLGPLPPPENLFARVNVALTSVLRGIPPTWTFLDTLPGNAFFSLTLNGPGIAGVLEDGVEVAGYTYDVEMTQSGENIFADQPDAAEGWTQVDDDLDNDGTVVTQDFDNADNDADSRIVDAADGDDTITISSNNTSAIYGSNAVPRIGSSSGSDGDGLCFIATAAFGTPLAREIDALRGVRDEYMLSNAFGRMFADTYYRLSPPIASDVARSSAAQIVVRAALVPAVVLSRWLLDSPEILLMALTGLGALVVLARRHRRA